MSHPLPFYRVLFLNPSPSSMKKTPGSNRDLSDRISRALNKIRKPSTAGEITELLNRDLDQGDRPFQEEDMQNGCETQRTRR
jgi:hypothetical protein